MSQMAEAELELPVIKIFPLGGNPDLHGCIILGWKNNDRLLESDLSLLDDLANLVGLLFTNIQKMLKTSDSLPKGFTDWIDSPDQSAAHQKNFAEDISQKQNKTVDNLPFDGSLAAFANFPQKDSISEMPDEFSKNNSSPTGNMSRGIGPFAAPVGVMSGPPPEFLHLLDQTDGGIENRDHGLDSLFILSNVLRQGNTISEKTPPLVETIKKMVGAQVGALALLDGDKLEFISGSGQEIEVLDFHLSYWQDPMWETLRDGTPRFKNTTPPETANSQSDFFKLMLGNLAAYAVIPLITPESTIGLIFLGFSNPQTFTPILINIFSAIGNMVGNAFNQIITFNALEKLVSDRSLELNTLYQITSVVNQSDDLPAAFEQALKMILKTTDTTMGSILLLNENEKEINLIASHNIPPLLLDFYKHLSLSNSLEGKVIEKGEKLIFADVTDKTLSLNARGIILPLSFNGLPMRIQNRTIGVLSILGVPGRILNIDQIALLTSIADHLALSVENYRLRKNAERSAVVEERARLAREFHDSVTQSLYSATLLTAAARELIKQGNIQEIDANLERLSTITQLSLKEMRLLVYELRSPALDEGGVFEAVRRRISAVELRAGVDASIEILNYKPLGVREEEELYRIALEGLNNSLKYSNASTVKIVFDLIDDTIILRILDNGIGFDPKEIVEKGGFGLRTMRERTEKMGGRLEINAKSGKGTNLSAYIPYRGN
jgi:signal transduction histidine kinase